MKFTANRKILLEYLKSMQKVVPKNPTVNELKGFLVEVNEDDGYVYLTANNLESAIQRKVKVNIETGGNFVMTAKMLVDILTVLDGTDVEFNEVQPGLITIKAGNCTYTMSVMSDRIYPRPEMPFPEDTVKISGLKLLYSKTAATVPTGEANKSLEGIHMDITEKKLRTVSCNRTCISIAEKEYECGGKLSFTLTKASMMHLASAVGNDDELEVGISGAFAVFMKEGMMFSARMLSAEYVDTEALLNSVVPIYTAKVEFDDFKERVLNMCDVSSLGKERSYVKMNFNSGKISMETLNECGMGSGELDVVCINEEQECSFFYPSNQLKDIFKTLDGTLILQVDKRGYMLVLNRNSKFMITPMSAYAVQKQAEQIEEIKNKYKTKTQKKQETIQDAKAA